MLTKKETKALGIGLGIDGAAITCMVMGALHPGTVWEPLGAMGYAVQVFAIWVAILIVPLMLLTHAMLRTVNRPYTEQEQKVATLFSNYNHSTFYRRWVFSKELLICLVFSAMGWIWLALGTLLGLYLVQRLWSLPQLPEAQVA